MKNYIKRIFKRARVLAYINLLLITSAALCYYEEISKINGLFSNIIKIKFNLFSIQISQMPFQNFKFFFSNGLLVVIIFFALNFFIIFGENTSIYFAINIILLFILNIKSSEVLKTLLVYMKQFHDFKYTSYANFSFSYNSLTLDAQKISCHLYNKAYIILCILLIANIVFFMSNKKVSLD